MERIRHPQDEVTIGIVGKYVGYQDSYKSLNEALVHGSIAHDLKLNKVWVEAEDLEGEDWEEHCTNWMASWFREVLANGESWEW